jgi:hypothetical protein
LTITANRRRQATFDSSIRAEIDDVDDDVPDDDIDFPDNAAIFSGLGSVLFAIFLAMF